MGKLTKGSVIPIAVQNNIMRKLSNDEIRLFTNQKNIDVDAVWNFLGTVHFSEYLDALANLEMDSKLYGWNKETIKAIYEGIKSSSNC